MKGLANEKSKVNRKKIIINLRNDLQGLTISCILDIFSFFIFFFFYATKRIWCIGVTPWGEIKHENSSKHAQMRTSKDNGIYKGRDRKRDRGIETQMQKRSMP